LNAVSLERSGAAVCVASAEATVERLTAEIDTLAADPDRLRHMAEAAQQLGRPDAAEVVASDLLEMGNIPREEDDDEEQYARHITASPLPSEVH
jgi:UDP-N-acetylglucosamine:LPS N-acetylglucosamine transferase